MTAAQPGSNAVCLPLADWPAGDRALWEGILAVTRGPFRRKGPGWVLGPWVIRNLQSSYGRWLWYLSETGALDPGLAPIERVTQPRLDEYLEDLLAHGNNGPTIKVRFVDLERILARMHPGVDVRWVSRPGGIPIHHLLDMTPRPRAIPDAAVLLAHAIELFQRGLAHRKPRCRRALVRDAALLGLLTTRAPRLRALAGLQLGEHLVRLESGWRLLRTPDLEKTGVEHETSLAAELTPILDRYVDVERKELLEGRHSDAVWIAEGGGVLAADTIGRQMRAHVLRHLGIAFGPHRSRAVAVTFLAHNCPDDPFAGSVLLNHSSPTTTLKHYNKARAIAAGQRYAALLAALRDPKRK